MGTSRRGGMPSRRRSAKPKRFELLILCEGTRTEDDYFTYLKRRHKSVNITVDSRGGVPMTLVERAASIKKREERDEKRGRGVAHDEIWCVFDRDEHPNFKEAVLKAAAVSIGVATSIPCFELWLLLHFQEQTAHLERDEAQRALGTHAGTTSKNKSIPPSVMETLYAQYELAKSRAIELDKMHKRNFTEDESNPSSNIWEIVDKIVGPEL